ncbi:nucleotidyltransferase family protein [Bacillus sp. A116_S68]|nr:nucleotidyltransferase family protein [Bacillus sp. A116_S68]
MSDLNKRLFFLCTGRIDAKEFEKLEDKAFIYKNALEHRLLDSLLSLKPTFFDNDTLTSLKSKKAEKRRGFLDVMNSFNQANINYVCLKGLAMKKYYPTHLERQSNDYDLLLKDFRDFWKAHGILLEKGYSLENYPYVANQKKCGGALYRKITDGLSIDIEINIGGFPLSECTWLVEPLIWSTKQIIVVDDESIHIPSDEFNMIILIAEVGTNGKKRIRDAVDFYYVSQCEYDTRFVDTYLKKLKLKKAEKVLLNMLFQLEQNTFKNSKTGLINELYYRFRTDLYHIIPTYRSNHVISRIVNHYVRLVLITLVEKDILLSQLIYFNKFVSPSLYLRLGLPVYLIQLDMNKHAFQEQTKGTILIVKTPIGTFMASSLCLNREEDFEIAHNMANTNS